MIRPFVPPSVAALRPIIVMQSDDELVGAPDAKFAEGHACGLLEGRLAGQREGEARARDELQAELVALREKLATKEATNTVALALDRLLAARAETDRALQATARDVLVSALRTLFPALLARAAGAEVAAIVREAIAVRAPEPLSLRAHPDTLACLAGEAFEGLALAPDNTLNLGAAELTWSGGGLTFDPATLLERVEAVLCPAPADTQETAT